MRATTIPRALYIALNVLWYAVAIVLAITVVLVAAGSTIAVQLEGDGAPSFQSGENVFMSIPVSFSVDVTANPITSPSLGIETAEIRDARGALRFPPRRGVFLAANLTLLIGALLIFLWVLAQLSALLRSLGEGKPFVPANATRVRRIAWAVIGGEIARMVLVYYENYYVMSHFSAAALRFDAWPKLNAPAIVNGLIILAIAEVFRAGTRLDEEQSLTV